MNELLHNYVRAVLREVHDTGRAEAWVEWLKSLSPSDTRPVTFKRRQEPGTTCCYCGLDTFVGVEHIIPRSAGGPVVALWNLAWACYPCNKKRASDIGPLSHEWMKNYRTSLDKSPEPTGWLHEAFLTAPDIPTKQELLEFFKRKQDDV